MKFLRITVLSLLLTAVTLAATLKSEVDWIATLPGVTIVTTQDQATQYEQTYSVQDPSSTYAAIQAGLRQRGWTMGPTATTGVTGVSTMNLVARKGNVELSVSLQNTGIWNTMSLVARSGKASGGATGNWGTPGFGNDGGGTAGDRLTIDESNHEGEWECNDSVVTVNSSNNQLTFSGTCQTVTINGSNNEIHVKARAPRITLNGSNNAVYWYSSANPTTPALYDNGGNNEIIRR